MSNKITYAQASRRLKELQYAKAQMGQLSINDEIHKKSLEIALPILEQQGRGEQGDIISTPECVLNEKWNAHFGLSQQPHVNPQPDKGEWIEWGGGECPVDPECVVAVQCRSKNFLFQHREAGKHNWEHNGWRASMDIIAYRTIPERDTNQSGDGA